MGLTLESALNFSPLDRCHVVGGAGGLHRIVSSVNIIDAPDPGPWMKPGDLLFTTGYAFKNDEDEQLRLFRYLNHQGCAGLAVKFKRFLNTPSQKLVAEADALNFPLIEIPYDLAVSDLMLTLMREIVKSKRDESERVRSNAFLRSLLNGEVQGEDSILAEGLNFGLQSHCDYTVLNVSFTLSNQSPHLSDFNLAIIAFVQEISAKMGVKMLIAETDEVDLILQEYQRKNGPQTLSLARDWAKQLIERFEKQFPGNSLAVGIGNRQSNVLDISKSYKQAQEALYLGRRITKQTGRVFEYKELESYALLQTLPPWDRQNFITSTLGKLLTYDKQHELDLLHTLEAYLSSGGRTAECAKQLYVHRNTVNFRIARIKELIGVDLDDSETTFRLQLALRILKLTEHKPHSS